VFCSRQPSPNQLVLARLAVKGSVGSSLSVSGEPCGDYNHIASAARFFASSLTKLSWRTMPSRDRPKCSSAALQHYLMCPSFKRSA